MAFSVCDTEPARNVSASTTDRQSGAPHNVMDLKGKKTLYSGAQYMPNTATAVMQPPKEQQPSNASIMSFAEMRESLFDALDANAGIITKACREIGVSFHAVHRERLRDPLFRDELALRIEEARNNHAAEMMALADRHVQSHLQQSLVPLTDEDGAFVLDDDFEPIMVSEISLKSAVEARREYRTQLQGGEGTNINVQNVAAAHAANDTDSAPVKRPRLIHGDAEILDIEPEATEETERDV